MLEKIKDIGFKPVKSKTLFPDSVLPVFNTQKKKNNHDRDVTQCKR